MRRAWRQAVKILTGLSFTAIYAMPQAYTISAKPGAVNYIEGNVFLAGQSLSGHDLKAVFLNANDVLSTEVGKAEILLTPGVFLRLGDNSQVRMISPSLIDTQIEVQRGAAMIEVDALMKDNRVSILDHGASITIEKNGLYRFTADENPVAAVIEGKAQVYFGDKKAEINKGRETLLSDDLKQEKFNSKKEDDLYAWSNVRSAYDAASSYQTAKTASSFGVNSYGGSFGGFGPYGYGMMGAGWYWNSGFNSWSWLPGSGAFYSPFGYGFYGAGLVGGAPVIVVPVRTMAGGVSGPTRVIPVNPKRPPVIARGSGFVPGSNHSGFDHQGFNRAGFQPGANPARPAMSPAEYQAARAQAARAFAQSGGIRNGSGASTGSFRGSSAGSSPGAGYRGGGGGGNAGGYHGGGGGGSSGGFHGGGGGGGVSGGGAGAHSGGGGGASHSSK